MPKKVTIKAKKGQKPITFEKGGLHETTNTPADEKVPASKVAAAAAGKYGKKGMMQANLMKNVLTGPKS